MYISLQRVGAFARPCVWVRSAKMCLLGLTSTERSTKLRLGCADDGRQLERIDMFMVCSYLSRRKNASKFQDRGAVAECSPLIIMRIVPSVLLDGFFIGIVPLGEASAHEEDHGPGLHHIGGLRHDRCALPGADVTG